MGLRVASNDSVLRISAEANERHELNRISGVNPSFSVWHYKRWGLEECMVHMDVSSLSNQDVSM